MRLKGLITATLMVVAMAALTPVAAHAHDFTATIGGQRLFFEITNRAKRTAAVTYNGSIADRNANEIEGKVEIPSKVRYNNVVYDVTEIGPKAFSGAKHLKGIVIPSGVTSIGDFAFEGCDSLAAVVFPGNGVTLGQGIFFGCPMIGDVTIGSDWKSVDLTMFRWSDSLRRVNIPAKVEKLRGVKKLKGLDELTVDPNNEHFASYDGILYSKDGKTLYACPRAYGRKVVAVREGTETITPGALIDCVGIEEIIFPASLTTLSFRETSRMAGLKKVEMQSATPIFTAFIGGEGRFLLQTANPKVVIILPKGAKKAYEGAMAKEAGEYAETPTGVPYIVTAQQLPTKKNLK